ncbi:MAG: hypothetical protein P8Z81_14155 [Deinococcales bacterium]
MFGVAGYVMDKYNYSRADFVIGMVLATMIERDLHISLTLYGNTFIFTRPVTLAMFVFVLVTTTMPLLRRRRSRLRSQRDGGSTASGAGVESTGGASDGGER